MLFTILVFSISPLFAFQFNNGTEPGNCGFTEIRWKLEDNTYMGDTISPFTQLAPLDTLDAGSFGTFYLIITDVDKEDSLKSFTYTLAHIAPNESTEYRCAEECWFNPNLPDSSLDLLEVQVVPNSWADTISKELHFFPISTLLNISNLSWSTEYKAPSQHKTYFISDSVGTWLKFRFSFGDYGHGTSFRDLLSRFEYRVSPHSIDTFNINEVVLGDTVLINADYNDTSSKAVVHARNTDGESIIFMKYFWLHNDKYPGDKEDGYSISNDSGTIVSRCGTSWEITYNKSKKLYQFTNLGQTESDILNLDSITSHKDALLLRSGDLEYHSIRNDSLFGRWDLSIPVSGSQDVDNHDTVRAALGDTLSFIWDDNAITKVKIIDLFSGTDYNEKRCLYTSVKVFHDYAVSILKDNKSSKLTITNQKPAQIVILNARGQKLKSFSSSLNDLDKKIQNLGLSQGYYIVQMIGHTEVSSYPLLIK